MKRNILFNAGAIIIVALVVLLNCQRAEREKPSNSNASASPHSEIMRPISYDFDSIAAEREILTAEPVSVEVDLRYAATLARAAWGEYRGSNDEEVLAVYWCIFNRVDASGYGMGNSIEYVVAFPNQFLGYSPYNLVDERLYELACEALEQWQTEKVTGELSKGRVLPPEFLWFMGNTEQTHNTYRDTYYFTVDTHYIGWNDDGEKIIID